jgi:hypothetical protein
LAFFLPWRPMVIKILPSASCKLLLWALWTKGQSWEKWCKPASARSCHKYAHSTFFFILESTS